MMHFFLIYLFFYSQLSFAEYRAFTLLITNNKLGTNKQFDSTLDPDQYKFFFPITSDETIHYIDTWLCKGNTSRLDQICTKPNRQPSSQKN